MNKPVLSSTYAGDVAAILEGFGVSPAAYTDGTLTVRTPLTGAVIGKVQETAPAGVAAVVSRADAAFGTWRKVPGPQRGELVRLFGEELRAAKT